MSLREFVPSLSHPGDQSLQHLTLCVHIEPRLLQIVSLNVCMLNNIHWCGLQDIAVTVCDRYSCADLDSVQTTVYGKGIKPC